MINETLAPGVVRAVSSTVLPHDWRTAEPYQWVDQQAQAAGAASFGAPRVGMRVLEIGTAADGYLAALVSELVGPGGSVISLAAQQLQVDRARYAYGDGPYGRTAFQAGSPLDGWPAGGPYDLVIATTPMRRLPHSWLRQCHLPVGSPWWRATIVVRLIVAAGAGRLLRVDVDEERQPIAPQLYRAACDELPQLHGDPDGYALRVRHQHSRPAVPCG